MIAELIAVGTELLLGNIANTDAQILSQGLSALGITVHHHTVVGDNPQRLREALETAAKRSDIILTTGGLGPTYDDLTKQTICETFGRDLELHEDILEEIRTWFQTKMGKPMPANNVQQAMLPVGCTVFDNPVGTARADTAEEAEAMLRPLVDRVLKTLGDVVYGVDVGSLEEVVSRLLLERSLTLSAAESCTGGLIAKRLTDLPGASRVFRGGVVSYTNSVKAGVLGVPEALLEEYGAVSEPVARAMAEGCRKICGSDLAVSVTGVAGPDRDDRGSEVGTIYIALAAPEGTICKKLSCGRGRGRDRVRSAAAQNAFDMLRRSLLGLPL